MVLIEEKPQRNTFRRMSAEDEEMFVKPSSNLPSYSDVSELDTFHHCLFGTPVVSILIFALRLYKQQQSVKMAEAETKTRPARSESQDGAEEILKPILLPKKISL